MVSYRGAFCSNLSPISANCYILINGQIADKYYLLYIPIAPIMAICRTYR